ncbi:malate synthase G [Pseudohongiella sp.]|uniref:Malate synthase n=1 Tax=marine sediment metagenome TaxID=412755 RepID=A0A0F9WEM0_9ZZZZ|nr:malate synthase G [Pseudohongiella sp.]HDZ08312.1 malate synthase G [Pseudohongiella sp.]HEA62588.1 malate synthase G [Pseudohongiella sp.]
MQAATQLNSAIDARFYRFINDQVLPLTTLDASAFWSGFINLVAELAPRNRELLAYRDTLQQQIDRWHQQHRDLPHDPEAYRRFLAEIGYLLPEPEAATIETGAVDDEIARIAGPQLVVPVKNARFAINAANARWGSLYDAVYGSNLIPDEGELAAGTHYNAVRGAAVIRYAQDFLDRAFPLVDGSHQEVNCYRIEHAKLVAGLANGSWTELCHPQQWAGLTGPQQQPDSIILRNHDLHIVLEFDRSGAIGGQDLAGVQDIKLESAVTTIMDCEDSVAAVDIQDKIDVYHNWLGLIRGDLSVALVKHGKSRLRSLNPDRQFTAADGTQVSLPGRALMLIRNVGLLMNSELMCDAQGRPAPEGIIDAVVTSLIASLDVNASRPLRNSRCGNIYIVKPKLHGPEEVAFTVDLFGRVEDLLELPRNTIKLGIMDEERRTTVNLTACIAAARHRVVFINTGFLDRTGDEIHTSMHAGALLPKTQLKDQPCIRAYEDRNVDIGLACGLPGRAQIGKGMWPMPDDMAGMMASKIAHPRAGASTAWVPSPTAATLHALHYHQVNVSVRQQALRSRARAALADILRIPLLPAQHTLTDAAIAEELENNIQGILGYVVRWIDQGVGCSKVPDIHQVGLMEDRATLRISSQHVANWLLHGICSEHQVMSTMRRMAEVVDRQNAGDAAYQPMATNSDQSLAFLAAKALIFEGQKHANGYTEPVLHRYRRLAKSRT